MSIEISLVLFYLSFHLTFACKREEIHEKIEISKQWADHVKSSSFFNELLKIEKIFLAKWKEKRKDDRTKEQVLLRWRSFFDCKLTATWTRGSNRVYILRSREFVPRESREIRDANSIGLACSSVSWLANGLLLIWLAACRIIHRRNSWREPRRSSSGWKNADETAISIRKLHAQCEFRRIWREFRNLSLLLL